MRLTIDDLERVNRIMRDQSVYPYISDDLSPPAMDYTAEALLSIPSCYFLGPDDNSVFLFTPINGISWEVHTNILPTSRAQSRDLGKAVLEYMFNETPCRKIVTWVPSFNQRAFRLALHCGLKLEGCNRMSFLKNGVLYDQYLLGITKEDYLCQRQQ